MYGCNVSKMLMWFCSLCEQQCYTTKKWVSFSGNLNVPSMWRSVHKYVWIISENFHIEWKVIHCVSVIVVWHHGYWSRQYVGRGVATHQARSEAVTTLVISRESSEYDQRETQTRTWRVTWLTARRSEHSSQALGDHCYSTGQDTENCEYPACCFVWV